MPQLHFYVPDDVAQALRRKAEAEKKSLSKYLAEVLKREVAGGWPQGYFEEVVGGWRGEPLERPPQGELEERDPL